MRNRIDIDSKDSRAIVREIGQRLQAFLKEEPELPGPFGRKLTGSANKNSRHQSILSAGTNFTVEPPRKSQAACHPGPRLAEATEIASFR